MPPSAVKTVRDQIFWQYAKLISKSAGFGINNRGFQMSRFIGLRDGKITWSSTIREWLREHEKPDEGIYCGSKSDLTIEHVLPRSRGGPDITDNVIRACKKCNSGKGGKRLYEWIGMKNKDDVNKRIDEICEKGIEITEKIDQLEGGDLQNKLKIMEELEINLNELLNSIKKWKENKKSSTIPEDITP